MLKNSVKAAIIITGIVGIVANSAGTGGTASAPADQKKAAVKKISQKQMASKTDTDSSRTTADSLHGDSLMQKMFSLKIVTDPESVAVLLDDSLKGASPCTLSGVAKGNHVLTLKKTGYYLKKAEITVDSVSSQELSFVLLRPAFLTVISDPAGAALSIDGNNEGPTPYANDKVKPGDHILKVEHRQYAGVEQTVSVKSGGCDTVRLTLEHSAAYKDSVSAALRAEEKLHKERFNFSIVSAIFCLCAIILVVVEANNQ